MAAQTHTENFLRVASNEYRKQHATALEITRIEPTEFVRHTGADVNAA